MAAIGAVSPVWPTPVPRHDPLHLSLANSGRNDMDMDLCDAGRNAEEDAGLDHTFADHARNLLLGKVLAEEAVESWRQACLTEANSLRYTAVGMQSAVNSMEDVFQSADFLKSEAITWSLVKRVVCGDKKLELGNIMPSGGLTFRQRVAKSINEDPDLLRCAHLVMWLEEMATNDKSSETEFESRPDQQFAVHDGLWEETINQSKFMQKISDDLITEFDLDAPGRQGRKICKGDHDAQQRMFKSVWKSIRKGDIREAMKTCQEAGQPLVAATLMGGGLTGPLPLHLDDESAENLKRQLFTETCGISRTVTWRLSCYNIAQVAKKGYQGQGVNYEAAVYGSLCGDLQSMLAACETWQDIVWAHAKSYLQITAEKGVLDIETNGLFPNNTDELLGVLSELGCMTTKTVLTRKWPLESLIGIQPSNTSEIFQLVVAKCIPSILEMTKLPFSVAQQLLVKGDLNALLNDVLWPWVMDSIKATKEMGCPEADVVTSFSVIRFSAHFALLLKILDTEHVLTGAAKDLESMLQAYVFSILNKGFYKLIPMYSLHVDPTYRDKLLHRTLAKMADVEDDTKRDWAKNASYWIDRRDDDHPEFIETSSNNPLSLLDTILNHSAACQKNPRLSPATRVEAARWIFFCRPDSPLARPKQSELSMLVNVFRDFVLSGCICTKQGARLAGCMPAWQYCYAAPEQSCDKEDRLILASMQQELNRLISFFKVEHSMQNWVSKVNQTIGVRHGEVFYRKGGGSSSMIHSQMREQAVKAELDGLENEGLELFDAAFDSMLTSGWVCHDARELAADQSDIEVILRFCELGSVESEDYCLFTSDRMADMDTALRAWATRLFRNRGIELHVDLRDGFVMLQASTRRQNVAALISEIVALCKGEIQEIGTLGVFSLTGNNADTLKLICQRIALGRLMTQVAKVQELLWVLGTGLHGKPALVEAISSNTFLMDCLSHSEAYAVLQSAERAQSNQFITPSLE
ncbi:hypothetical protein BSKO_11992 [Bryopsis sp. KO-2023]|nr:hypothetical protein BSKO_11992 [Bryopsis sp. KO-2023]